MPDLIQHPENSGNSFGFRVEPGMMSFSTPDSCIIIDFNTNRFKGESLLGELLSNFLGFVYGDEVPKNPGRCKKKRVCQFFSIFLNNNT